MLSNVLTAVNVIASGVIAGVFLALAVSVLPALAAMAPAQYVQAHQLLGRGYHPLMPVLVASATATDIALAAVLPDTSARVLAAAGAIALAGVMAVSQFGNVPINKVVHATAAITPGWADPRPAWRHWHLVRTWLAFAALALNTIAVLLRV
jgi:uncharacterized membrane protein